jgi:hypothetical protein
MIVVRTCVMLVAAFLLCTQVARSQDPTFTWDMPPPDAQLAADTTEIPIGMGAIFVPAIVPAIEAPSAILVVDDDVREINVGERVLVRPGSYVVIVGSGSPSQGVGQPVEVVEGRTTLVPVKWGALRVEVTDERRVPHRGAYDILRADTREPFGTGFGVDTLQGEQLTTWMLPPGLYRIVRQGANYRSLTNWLTVYVPEAGLVRYRLVSDEETGEFLAGGQLLPDDFGTVGKRSRTLFSTLVLGVDGSLVHTQNVVGFANQMIGSASVFADGQLGWNNDPHFVSLLMQVEEGASQIRPVGEDPLPLVKGVDRLRGDLLYTWYITPAIGPYARGAGETQAFATNVLTTSDTTFLSTLSDGTVQTDFVAANGTFLVADPWAPTIVREGAGINTRFITNRWFNLNWRVGLGLRQNLYGGALLLADLPATPEVEYVQVESFNEQGVESTIVLKALLPGWAVYATDVELFAGFETFTKPSVEWRNTLSLRVTRNLSLNYYLNVDYLPVVVESAQLQQSILLRASWEIL